MKVVKYATTNSTLATVDSVILYKCEENYIFPNGDREMVIICDDGHWSKEPDHCQGWYCAK